MTAAPSNGITIEYDVHGDEDAPALLLVMGLGGQLVGWPDEFVEQLAKAGPYRVIRYDNRDVGLSTHDDHDPPTTRQVLLSMVSRRAAHPPYLIADMAADGVGLLDHLGVDRAHVVGISMGGMIAQTMAIEHPRRVASLTSIMSNTGDRKHGKVSRQMMRKAPKLLKRRPEDDPVERGVEMFRLISGPHFDEDGQRALTTAALARSDDVDGTSRQMMAIAGSPDRTAALGRVRVPTLVVHGLLDPLVKPDGGVTTALAVPGARLVMFPDMAHDLPRPRWDDLFAEIVATTRQADGTR